MQRRERECEGYGCQGSTQETRECNVFSCQTGGYGMLFLTNTQ